MRSFKTYFSVGALLCTACASALLYNNYQVARLRSGTTPIAESYNTYLEQRAKAGEFTGTVLMAHNGTPILEQGYGFANRQIKVSNTTNTVYCIASVGKLFTAVAIAQLVEQGKLSFNAPIGRYLSGFSSTTANDVTVGELLDMTGGFGNVVPVSANYPATLADLMKPVYTESLVSSPGTRFNYSNDGYVVLGAIVQQVSGEPYTDYIKQHIFDPAGMHNTEITAYKPLNVANMAHGYTDQGGKLVDISSSYQIANPSGGAYSTAGDLLKFAEAFTGHRLLTPTMTNTILVPRVSTPRPGGPAVDDYTYGFGYQKENGTLFVGHNGGTQGYEDQLDIYPDKGYVVVVLTNQDNVMVPAIQKSESLLT